MRISAIAFSELGASLGAKLGEELTGLELTRCESGGLTSWVDETFSASEALVFIGSVGIAVRAIASHVKSKTTDPAVVVIDEQGRFVIAVLSGHIGQANQLTSQLADLLGAVPVITTATDGRGLFAVDDWATRQGLVIRNPGLIKRVSAKLLRGESIRLASEFPISGVVPKGVELVEDRPDVVISHAVQPDVDALILVPRTVTAGIGCRKGIPANVIEQQFASALSAAELDPLSIKQVCSIDLKATEPGLLDFCENRGLDFHTFSAVQLAEVDGEFTPSKFVASTVGVDNVCERSAVLGSGGALLLPKFPGNGVTVAFARGKTEFSFDEPTNHKER